MYCPINAWDCPYWEKDGNCTLNHPEEECDDYAYYNSAFNDEDENNIYIFEGIENNE